MEQMYDVIVVGVGSMGSSACYYLAKSGLKVLGLEQFDLVHEKGSHTGESRFVRMAYFEHPDYVPLLKRAYHNWDHLEKESGKHLFHKTGIVYFGVEESVQIEGVRRSADTHALPIEEVSASEVPERYEQFTIPNDFHTIFEANAGFVQPEVTIATYIELARIAGAKINSNETVREWESMDGHITCRTDKGNYTSKKIIFTAGAWTQQLVPSLQTKLQVTQQALMWYKPKDITRYQEGNFPCWSITDPAYEGMFYGFPIFLDGNPTMKLAYHAHGTDITPDQKAAQASAEELEPIHFFLRKYMPELQGEISDTKTCLYNYSTDEDFIIDHLPGYDDNVIIACGFSGHGFKFVPVVGEIIKDLVVDGETDLPVGFLGWR